MRHLGAPNSPVLILQSRCDRLEDEVHPLPAPPELLAALPHWELQYSALNNRKRAALDDALREAVERIKGLEGETTIGAGRLKVKQRLEELRDSEASVPPEQRQYRTVTQADFRQLCEQAGGITAPEHLLSYLHNSGIVFYRPGLFDDRIILDQGWALEAIYAVFNRESCYRPLRHLRGRFTREILEALVWREYNAAEQEVFLGMMRSCGICFVHRRGKDNVDEYIAPDLLPGRDEIQAELDAMWDAEAAVKMSEFEYALLHPGVVRSVISRIGSEAGGAALYWRGGLCVYEMTTRSRALIEQEMADEWRGKLVIRTQRGQAAELLRRLSALVRQESARWVRNRLTPRWSIDRYRLWRPYPRPTSTPGWSRRNPCSSAKSSATRLNISCPMAGEMKAPKVENAKRSSIAFVRRPKSAASLFCAISASSALASRSRSSCSV